MLRLTRLSLWGGYLLLERVDDLKGGPQRVLFMKWGIKSGIVKFLCLGARTLREIRIATQHPLGPGPWQRQYATVNHSQVGQYQRLFLPSNRPI